MSTISCRFYIIKYPVLLTKRASEKLERTWSITIWTPRWQNIWLKQKNLAYQAIFTLVYTRNFSEKNLAKVDVQLN